MRITRLQKGYIIRLSDGEFEALSLLAEHGQRDSEGDDPSFDSSLSRAGKRALRGERFKRLDFMSVDENRRTG